jgi:hypothetical protein
MFNRTYVDNSYRSPSKIEVTEKKAPTDESIKILKEFEQAAMDKIVAMGKVEDNVINFKWYITYDPYSLDGGDVCKCYFTLNGKEYDFQFVLPCPRYARYGKTSEIVEKIRENMLQKLGEIFIMDLFKSSGQRLMDIYANRK